MFKKLVFYNQQNRRFVRVKVRRYYLHNSKGGMNCMAKFVMALDAGTTSNRCILFNEKGEMCSVAQKEFTQYVPKPGWVEHDATEIWEAQLAAAREALKNAEISVSGIVKRIVDGENDEK